MQTWYQPEQATVESALLEDLSIDEPWALIERFTTLVRESSSEDEREAARYITARLEALGVPHTVYEPDLFLSVPISASVEVEDQRLRAKTPSMAVSTDEEGVTGEVVYVSSNRPGGLDTLFHFSNGDEVDVRGKIVLTDGYAFPVAVRHYEERGAIAQIFINPGVDIHWGICTTIWGAPDLDSAPRQPKVPVAAINRPDGEALKAKAQAGRTVVTVRTQHKQGWFPCPVIVAEIEGCEEPERFLLVHGHYDSWDVGIGDNAVGDGTLLELARVFHNHRDRLARSMKIAWWPGHSTGRYAGSTWFADTFALELDRNCIAQVDIDSPGCRWATEYHDISWMTETEDFCVQAIHDITGKEAFGERPHQAGDYSFNNIGLSGFFMLFSTMPKALREEKGYYPVGGCGANIAWHTENDRLEIADKDHLMRDLRVYVATLQRVLNNAIHPFDSPGCRWATEYHDISWMTEAEDFCVQAIHDITGKEAFGERPHQAGDYSFNNIGLSGFFMLFSTMPKALREEKGYYPVGGCGANIAWHTENDRLEIADKDHLMRDLRVYVATLQRVLNNAIHPFDFRKLGRAFRDTLNRYAEGTDGTVDFGPAFAALDHLQEALERLYQAVPGLANRPVSDPAVRAVNDVILELGRWLIPINYTRTGRFRTDPAVPIPPLPDLAPAQNLAATTGHERNVLRTHLLRGVNRVAWTFERAAKVIEAAYDLPRSELQGIG